MPRLLLVGPVEAEAFFSAHVDTIIRMAPDLPIDVLQETESLRWERSWLLRADEDDAAVIVQFHGGGLALRHIFRFGTARSFARRYWPSLVSMARDIGCEFIYTRARNKAVARLAESVGLEDVGCGHLGVIL